MSLLQVDENMCGQALKEDTFSLQIQAASICLLFDKEQEYPVM